MNDTVKYTSEYVYKNIKLDNTHKIIENMMKKIVEL